MRCISFGPSKTKVSEVVLGTMRIAQKTPQQVAELIQTALDCGINAVDTAPIYGPSEGIIGDAFAVSPGLRDRVWLQTKLGIRPHPRVKSNYFDFSYEHIIESVENSLTALRTDHIDSLLLHRPDALMEPDEIARAFQVLHDAGKVIDFGVSNQNPAMMRRLAKHLTVPITANQVQISAAFTPMFDAFFNANMQNDAAVMRDGGILEYCGEHDMAIQAWSVLQHGYFGGVFLGDANYAELNAALERIAAEHDSTPTAVAINWVLRYPAKMQAIVGTTRPERVRASAAACDWQMSREEWYEIYLCAGNMLP
ncbi:MAG: aldo/keto reductase [Coriobacteriales bacterium]|nr:aldo/keto reductase [Coriobacteriales bacterium]